MNKYNLFTDIERIDEKQWVNFVKSHINGNIFQTPNLFRAYQQIDNYEPLVILIKNQNDDILGVQVSVLIKLYSNSLGYFTARSIVFGGPLILNNDSEVLNTILGEYINRIKNKAIVSQYRNMWDWDNLKSVFFKNKILFQDHLDILIDLTKGEEKVWSEMKRVRRKGINQSYKNNVIVKEIDITNEEQLKEAYSIIKTVYKRIKLPLHEIDYFHQAKIKLGDEMLAIGLFIKDELVAVRFALCFNKVIFDWYAGAKEEFLYCRPNDVLPWELMKWGMLNNYKVFDFGGAGKPNIPYGVRDHKLKFGGDLVNFGRFEIIHKPLLMKVVKIGFKIKQAIS